MRRLVVSLGNGPILVLILVVATLGLGCARSDGVDDVSRRAPDFELERIGGGTLRLSDYRGKVVLLHFWATWCPPCLEAIPFENELQAKYGDDGLVVLGMSMNRDPGDVREFLRENSVNYPIAMVDKPTREAFGGVYAVPLTILVDRNGVIRKEKMGHREQDVALLELKIERLLKGS